MGILSEDGPAHTAYGGALRDGLEQLSLDQEIPFRLYSRTVLPLDGYIFWTPIRDTKIKGSLHYSQQMTQQEDETAAVSSVTFTSEHRVEEFIESPTNTLWVGTHEDMRFTIGAKDSRYSQVGNLYHYGGQSILPALASQLLDKPGQIDPAQAVVSNSLPFWLALNTWAPPAVLTDLIPSPGITLYPSFQVPTNLTPPYGVVHIPDDTDSLQYAPYIDQNLNDWQLARDRVRVTLFGLQNNAVRDFFNFVLQYTVLTSRPLPGTFGIMNSPIPKDGKRAAAEMQVLAMQKVIDFEISYYQHRAAAIAKQLITQAQATVVLNLHP